MGVMYALSTTVVSLGILITALSGSQQGAPDRAKDEAAIREVVKQYVATREKGDAAGLGALFTSDADQLVSSGEWRHGRAEVVKGTLASTKQSGGTRTIVLETIRFPTRDVALADGRYEITGGTGGDRRMWSAFVMVREGGGWRIAAIRNMLPAPPAQ
jgi:uncharacterized protein (TIGR02246 family)